mgnify:CR=1 FL=1
MKNIKGIAFASDGNMKRMAVTYDELDESGKVIKSNIKINRIVMDAECLSAISDMETYAASILNEE